MSAPTLPMMMMMPIMVSVRLLTVLVIMPITALIMIGTLNRKSETHQQPVICYGLQSIESEFPSACDENPRS
ncbi:hypothetical protein CIT26_30550 [Mesorhizobium temperatum]|uniref:Uncharacterized protein n=1 Tax=Mesorhizobium temperatum TaxID=241416 RepID=A0A271LC34_9HYPH|nr:hypothetical protein CIT26_30550 [Mesorhizobium temperatum]